METTYAFDIGDLPAYPCADRLWVKKSSGHALKSPQRCTFVIGDDFPPLSTSKECLRKPRILSTELVKALESPLEPLELLSTSDKMLGSIENPAEFHHVMPQYQVSWTIIHLCVGASGTILHDNPILTLNRWIT